MERAEEYRARANVSAADSPLAVILQPLVPAVAAGVAFTADPTSGARSYFLLNATWGLGTTLVDGRVEPDQYRIPKDCTNARRVLAVVGEKGVRDRCGPGGLVTEPTPAEQRTRVALRPRGAIRLARLLERVEHFAGAPQDVEWAWDGRSFWILQSRPITRL